MTGAGAGAANLFNEFKIPDWKETMEMNKRNGKVMRESSVAKANLPSSPAKPGARTATTQGIKNSTASTNNVRTKANSEMARAAKRIALFLSPDTSFATA